MAGLAVKNALDAEQPSIAATRHARWIAQTAEVRSRVKGDLVAALSASAAPARQSAAQAIAKVGKIEVPVKGWPELVPGLVATVMGAGVPPGAQVASLIALGFLCEEIVSAESGSSCSSARRAAAQSRPFNRRRFAPRRRRKPTRLTRTAST